MKELEITARERVLRLEPIAGAAEVEHLTVPPETEAVYGLEQFTALRHLTYLGTGDLLGFGELLDWLNKPAHSDEVFLTRLATNLRAAKPLSQYLTVLEAPNMTMPHTLPGWETLLERCDDVISRSNGYGRQDVCLCALTCGQLKQIEYALRLKADFTPEERVLYGLAVEGGLTWREFYAVRGDHDYRHLRTKDGLTAYLARLPLADDGDLRRRLETLLRTGLLGQAEHPAAVALLQRRGLTEATAFLLDYGHRHWGGTGFLDTEFAL